MIPVQVGQTVTLRRGQRRWIVVAVNGDRADLEPEHGDGWIKPATANHTDLQILETAGMLW